MTDETTPAEPFSMPSSQPVLLRALRFEVIATVSLLIIFGGIGYLVSGAPGLFGGVLGAVLSGALSALTIGSIAFANHRFIDSQNYIVIFFAIVAGSWLFKLIAFIVCVVLLRDQPWLDSRILFFSFIAGIIASLIIDVLVATKSRMPYVSDAGHSAL